VEGVETACGYVSWLGKKEDAASESLLVRELKHCGAVLFVKTNVPMSLLVSPALCVWALTDHMVRLLTAIEDGQKLPTISWDLHVTLITDICLPEGLGGKISHS
jgi:hypothetical protein